MIPPKARIPIALIACGMGIAIPLTVVGLNAAKTQASIDADKAISENLMRLAKDDIAQACYKSNRPLKKGEEFATGEQPTSVCAKYGDRVAFLEIREGKVIQSEIFTSLQLQNARSTVLTKGKK
jgi:hypothetical protein